MKRRRIITLIVILAIAGITVLFTRIELQGVKSKLKLEMEKPPKIEYRDVFVLTTPAVTLKHETLAYVKTFESEVTMYTLGYSSCQKKPNHQQYGQVAASGTIYAGLHPMYVRPRHTIAMDKSIPFGTFVKIDGFDEIFVVEDRGSAITGNDIDIYIESEKDAMEFGRQKRKVWILKYGEK